jgi:hypothetical protein
VHQTKSLDHGLDPIDDWLVLMAETRLVRAEAWEHGWLFFRMDTEGREISTRLACSHHLLASDVSVECNGVPIATTELSHRKRFEV